MWTPLVVAVVVACAVLAAWALRRTVKDQPVILRQLLAAGVVEALVVAELVVAALFAAGGRTPQDVPTFWGYLLTTAILLPVAAAWAFAERTRWSSVVLLCATLTVAFLQYRLLQVWGTA